MAMLDMPVRVEEFRGEPRRLDDNAERDLRDALQQAKVDQAPDRVEIEPWFYWIPYAGVRYYSFDKRLTPAIRGRLMRTGPVLEGIDH